MARNGLLRTHPVALGIVFKLAELELLHERWNVNSEAAIHLPRWCYRLPATRVAYACTVVSGSASAR